MRFLRSMSSHLIPAEACSDGNLIVAGFAMHVRVAACQTRRRSRAITDQTMMPATIRGGRMSPKIDQLNFSTVATAAGQHSHFGSSRT